MRIKIKKIHSNAILPKYAHEGDAGMDVYAITKTNNSEFVEYGTGLVFEIPEGYVCLVFPRSSISNKSLSLCNSVGVLDPSYRGELKIRFYKHKREEYEIGERIAQIVILPFPKIEFEETGEISDTARGSNGFGSTGK